MIALYLFLLPYIAPLATTLIKGLTIHTVFIAAKFVSASAVAVCGQHNSHAPAACDVFEKDMYVFSDRFLSYIIVSMIIADINPLIGPPKVRSTPNKLRWAVYSARSILCVITSVIVWYMIQMFFNFMSTRFAELIGLGGFIGYCIAFNLVLLAFYVVKYNDKAERIIENKAKAKRSKFKPKWSIAIGVVSAVVLVTQIIVTIVWYSIDEADRKFSPDACFNILLAPLIAVISGGLAHAPPKSKDEGSPVSPAYTSTKFAHSE